MKKWSLSTVMVSNVNSPLRVNGNSVSTIYKHAEMKFSHYTQPFESNAGALEPMGYKHSQNRKLCSLRVTFCHTILSIAQRSSVLGIWMKIFHHKWTSVKVMILQFLNNPNLKISKERSYCNIYPLGSVRHLKGFLLLHSLSWWGGGV